MGVHEDLLSFLRAENAELRKERDELRGRIAAIAAVMDPRACEVKVVFAREAQPAPDACYADCISPDVPDGHDTVLGYLARHHADVLDLIDPSKPQDSIRDGFWLAHESRRLGLEPVYVDAPPILQRAGIFRVRAYPLRLLAKRWGDIIDHE